MDGVKQRLRVYIDIDGTILYDPPYGRGPDHLDLQQICDGLEEFLLFVVEHCEPYWLSYRTHQGNIQPLEERLFPHLPPVARSIPAAYWDTWKHEAVDPMAAVPVVRGRAGTRVRGLAPQTRSGEKLLQCGPRLSRQPKTHAEPSQAASRTKVILVHRAT